MSPCWEFQTRAEVLAAPARKAKFHRVVHSEFERIASGEESHTDERIPLEPAGVEPVTEPARSQGRWRFTQMPQSQRAAAAVGIDRGRDRLGSDVLL